MVFSEGNGFCIAYVASPLVPFGPSGTVPIKPFSSFCLKNHSGYNVSKGIALIRSTIARKADSVEFILTLGLFALCMSVMAIGLLFKRKPIAKDCGLDPVTGERVTDCACANQGKPQCFQRKVMNLFESDHGDSEKPGSSQKSAEVVRFPKE